MSDKRKLHKFQWIRHPDYYRVAKSNYRVIEALKRQHDALQLTLESKEISDQDVNRLAEKNNAIGEHALIVVVFSAFTLEAYINDYGITRLSKKYFSNYLDRLDLLSKWLVVPRLLTGKQLDPGSRAMQEVTWLVAIRNKLAHYKSKTVTVLDVQESDFIWAEDAQRAVEAVRYAVEALKAIDPVADTAWID